MAYVTPVHYYSGRKARLRLIVIHTMESPEHDDTAENVAGWFAGRSGTAPLASAHACVDNNSVVLCLPPSATAWAAPGANADGYQIEQAGRAAQGITGWADAYSQSMLRLSAAHARSIAQAAGIPLVHLTDAQLAAGAAGFVGHDQVSRVYKKSDHTDPGSTFPWTQYMTLVNGGTPTTKGFLMALTDQQQNDLKAKVDSLNYAVSKIALPALSRLDKARFSTQAQVTALTAAVNALATAKGVDPEVITRAVQESVDKALKDVEITLTTKGN